MGKVKTLSICLSSFNFQWIPIYRNGIRWGVLDADSHERACFGSTDIEGLTGVLRAAGLLHRDLPIRADLVG